MVYHNNKNEWVFKLQMMIKTCLFKFEVNARNL